VEDGIHPGVGLSRLKKIGETVAPGEPLCLVHAASRADFERVRAFLEESFDVSPPGEPWQETVIPLVQEWIT
jgi:thymidine phosphorylase